MIIINQLPSAIHWKDCIMTTPFTPTEPTPGWNWVLKVCQHSCKFLMMVKAVHTHLWRHLHTHTQYIYIYTYILIYIPLSLSLLDAIVGKGHHQFPPFTPKNAFFHPKMARSCDTCACVASPAQSTQRHYHTCPRREASRRSPLNPWWGGWMLLVGMVMVLHLTLRSR